MAIEINFLTEMPEWRAPLKAYQPFWEQLVTESLKHAPLPLPEWVAVNILLGDNDVVQHLNREYREIDKPTNILSFPQVEAWDIEGLNTNEDLELGDLVLAWGVVADEAKAQDKDIRDHVAHLLVHGTLHLLGYDHLDEAEADRMEALETAILSDVGIADPYILTD